jgi:hypothetical protein
MNDAANSTYAFVSALGLAKSSQIGAFILEQFLVGKSRHERIDGLLSHLYDSWGGYPEFQILDKALAHESMYSLPNTKLIRWGYDFDDMSLGDHRIELKGRLCLMFRRDGNIESLEKRYIRFAVVDTFSSPVWKSDGTSRGISNFNREITFKDLFDDLPEPDRDSF